MRNISLLALTFLLACSCNREKTVDFVILEGNIENPEQDSLTILSKDRESLRTLRLSKNNDFRDTLFVAKGYYYLRYGDRFAQIYLKPGQDLKLAFNGKDVEEPINFVGNGADENNYLAQKALFQSRLRAKNNYNHYLNLDERSFLQQTDSLFNSSMNFLKDVENLDPMFINLEEGSIVLEKAARLNVYKNMSRQKPNFDLSENYPSPYREVDFNNEVLLAIPSFVYHAEAFYQNIVVENHITNDTLDFLTATLKTIDSKVENEKVKQDLAFNTAYNRILYSNNLEGFYETYLNICTNEEYRQKVKERYQKLKKIEKGAISPTFELFDINEKLVTLDEFKGKVVFIDLWATWCAPCIQEIPSLRNLEEAFQGRAIQFVSICKSDTKERWTNMVREKKLGGVQLFAPDDDMPFFQDYMVEGIPRFIIIDTNGRIIDSNAKRPSHPELKDDLEAIL